MEAALREHPRRRLDDLGCAPPRARSPRKAEGLRPSWRRVLPHSEPSLALCHGRDLNSTYRAIDSARLLPQRHEETKHEHPPGRPPAVSRRPRRQPAAAAGAAAGVPAPCRQARSATTSSRASRTIASATSVRMQEEIGLAVVTDGEFRRGSYWGRFVERTQGLEVRVGAAQVSRRPRPRGRFHRALCDRAAAAHRVRSRSTSSSSCAMPPASRRRSRCRRPRPCISCASPISPIAAPMPTPIASSPISSRCSRRRSPTWCGRLPLPADRRDRHRAALRSRDPRQGGGRGRRPRCAGRALYRCHQRLRSRPARPMSSSASTCAAAISRGNYLAEGGYE